MAEQRPHYFVRPGSAGPWKSLSGPGHVRAHTTARWLENQLAAEVAAGEVVLMASSNRRTVETAEKIGALLGVSVISSPRLAIASQYPGSFSDLDEMVNQALREEGQELKDRRLIAVAHLPLLSVIKNNGDPEGLVDFAEIVPYISGTWPSELYDQKTALIVESALAEVNGAQPPPPPTPV